MNHLVQRLILLAGLILLVLMGPGCGKGDSDNRPATPDQEGPREPRRRGKKGGKQKRRG